MSKENIIQIRADINLQQASPEQRRCHHSHILVVEDMRLLLCQDCQKWIEPFDYMLGWARRQWAAKYVLEEAERQTKRLAEKVDELKREERNVRARLKRLKKKLGKDDAEEKAEKMDCQTA